MPRVLASKTQGHNTEKKVILYNLFCFETAGNKTCQKLYLGFVLLQENIELKVSSIFRDVTAIEARDPLTYRVINSSPCEYFITIKIVHSMCTPL